MASYQVLLLVLVAVACSLFAVSIGWCTQSNLSSSVSVVLKFKFVATMTVFLVQAASVGFVPWIPIALSLKVVVRVDADLTVWDIYILPNQTVDLNHPVMIPQIPLQS